MTTTPTRLYFVVPVHGREALTRVCLNQLRRTCDALAPDIEATAVVIGEGDLLTFARTLGFATVERNNNLLGRRFNDGYQLACDPDINPEPADYVVPCGSDDWVDPVIFNDLPRNAIGVFRQLAIVNETRTQLARLHVGYTAGCGIRIIPSHMIARCGYRPAEEDRNRGCDTSTLYGMMTSNRKVMPKMVYLDVHPLQIVDWKSRGEQLNSYEVLRGYRRGAESEDPFAALAGVYPDESLEEMKAL